jgi:hypothetical protein
MEDAAFAVGLGLGSVLLASVCFVYLRSQSFGVGGSFLSICGLILVGMSAWSKIDVSVTTKDFSAKFEQIEKHVADVENQTNQSAQALRDISDKIDTINKHLAISSNGVLTSQQENEVGSALEDYLKYLGRLGYNDPIQPVHVVLGDSDSTDSYYNSESSTLFISARDKNNDNYKFYLISVLTEYMHKVLYSNIDGNKYSKHWDGVRTWVDLEFSLQKYLPRSFMDLSVVDMGGDNDWDLNNTTKFGHKGPCRNLACERDQPWAGAYWDLRQKLGRDIFDKILFESWQKLQPEQVGAGNGGPFVEELLQSDGGRHAKIIHDVFEERGLDVPLKD